MFTITIACTLFGVLVSAEKRSYASVEKRSYAVTPLDGAEQFYLKLHDSRASLQPVENVTLATKIDICTAIIGSPLFDAVHRVKPAKPMDVEIELLHAGFRIFKNLLSSVFEYRRIEIDLNGEHVPEYGFLCLAWPQVQTQQELLQQKLKGHRRRARVHKQYFVSVEYQLNNVDEGTDEMEPGDQNVFGRFVFTYNKTFEKGVLVALAEEPGRTVRVKDAMPSSYAEWREQNAKTEFVCVPEENEINGTICELPLFLKIRLCTIILSAKEYAKTVTFEPSERNVDPQCVRKDIVIKQDKNRTLSPPHTQDWMIGCRAVKLANNESATYHISRGFSAHNYFICSTDECAKPSRMCVAGVTCRIEAKAFLNEEHFLANKT